MIDRKTLFVGSMNLDPRSATINTELGAVIHSPQLAREMIRIIDIDRLQSAYLHGGVEGSRVDQGAALVAVARTGAGCDVEACQRQVRGWHLRVGRTLDHDQRVHLGALDARGDQVAGRILVRVDFKPVGRVELGQRDGRGLVALDEAVLNTVSALT